MKIEEGMLFVRRRRTLAAKTDNEILQLVDMQRLNDEDFLADVVNGAGERYSAWDRQDVLTFLRPLWVQDETVLDLGGVPLEMGPLQFTNSGVCSGAGRFLNYMLPLPEVGQLTRDETRFYDEI